MKSLIYKFAVLSFCSDLTSPSAESSPIAVVGVSLPSEAARDGFWFFVSQHHPGRMESVAKDPIASSILNSLPSLLEQQLEQGVREAPPGKFLTWLHDRFRNSLYVASIQDRVVTMRSDVDPIGCIIQDLLDVYATQVAPENRSSLPNIEIRNLLSSPARTCQVA